MKPLSRSSRARLKLMSLRESTKRNCDHVTARDCKSFSLLDRSRYIPNKYHTYEVPRRMVADARVGDTYYAVCCIRIWIWNSYVYVAQKPRDMLRMWLRMCICVGVDRQYIQTYQCGILCIWAINNHCLFVCLFIFGRTLENIRYRCICIVYIGGARNSLGNKKRARLLIGVRQKTATRPLDVCARWY